MVKAFEYFIRFFLFTPSRNGKSVDWHLSWKMYHQKGKVVKPWKTTILEMSNNPQMHTVLYIEYTYSLSYSGSTYQKYDDSCNKRIKNTFTWLTLRMKPPSLCNVCLCNFRVWNKVFNFPEIFHLGKPRCLGQMNKITHHQL